MSIFTRNHMSDLETGFLQIDPLVLRVGLSSQKLLELFEFYIKDVHSRHLLSLCTENCCLV